MSKHIDDVIVERAAELVRQGHCKLNLAVDWRGRGCLPADVMAERFCAIGALHRAAHEVGIEMPQRNDCVAALLARRFNDASAMPWHIAYINDSLGRDAILSLFDNVGV